MKKLSKFSFFILFSFFLETSNASENIGFINIDFLVKNSNVGKKILKDIENLDNKNIDILEKKNKDLIELENSIKNKKNIISNEDFEKEVKNFQKKLKLFTEEKNKIVKDFNNYRKMEFDKIFKQINPIITNYMEKNNLSILFESKNIFMGKEELNVTKKVLEIINQQIK